MAADGARAVDQRAATRCPTRSGRAARLAACLLGLMALVIVAYVATAPVTRAAANVAGPAAAAPEPSSNSAAGSVTTTAAPTPSSEPTADPVVAVVGDSLAYSAGPQLGTALEAAGFTPRADFAPGRQIPVRGLQGRVSAGVDAIRSLKAEHPAVWVVQLGTNDVLLEAASTDRYAELISSVLDTIGQGAPVIWVNVWRADRRGAALMFDDVLKVIAAQRPQLHIADWASVAEREPVLLADGVHLNDEGLQRFTETMLAAVLDTTAS